ncbi:heavy metal translocating P-type ATPase [Acidiferrimicrobium sp. IK]|nr:heavy metal translocating P-type ATPase [Acidiferrimicrobium sp. IK]
MRRAEGPGRAPRPGRPASGLAGLREVRWAAGSLACFALAALLGAAGGPPPLQWVLWAACYASGGWEPGAAGLRALRARVLDVDLLMVVAAVAAAAIGQRFDGGLLIVIFATSGALEAVATHRTEQSVRALLDLAPETATVLDDAGHEREVATGDLKPGDTVVVRPGERVGADGTVRAGASEVDQASITGESTPAVKGPGDEVYSGSVNGSGLLRVEVARPASESVVARIVALVEAASATKARTQLFIERLEQRYSVTVVAATVAFVVVPLLVTDWSFRRVLLEAMTFMIVASPCAVVLATMPPLLSAVALAGRHGVLVKSTVVLEQLAGITTVAFDKTGTLTAGRPEVTSVVAAAGWGRDEVVRLAAAAEAPSEHALGRAIAAAARRSKPEPGSGSGAGAAAAGAVEAQAGTFRALPGRGVEAVVAGAYVEVLSPRAASEATAGEAASDAGAWWRPVVGDAEAEGGTAVVVLADGTPVGVIAMRDRVRLDAPDAVARLAELTGRRPVLLTGDNLAAARQVAEQVGITDVAAGLLPEDKVAAVVARQAAGEVVMVVGDGVNDAPALAAANLGMAMGKSGSDVTLQVADGVIMRDALSTLPALMTVARRARRMVHQHLALASAVIVVLVGLDVAGHLPLPLGVAGHEGSTVVIGLNGLRLLRRRAWPEP